MCMGGCRIQRFNQGDGCYLLNRKALNLEQRILLHYISDEYNKIQ